MATRPISIWAALKQIASFTSQVNSDRLAAPASDLVVFFVFAAQCHPLLVQTAARQPGTLSSSVDCFCHLIIEQLFTSLSITRTLMILLGIFCARHFCWVADTSLVDISQLHHLDTHVLLCHPCGHFLDRVRGR